LGLICPQEEDFGLTALEVQSCGHGVIAYDSGGTRETVVNQKTGIFFKKQSIDSIQNAVKDYLKSPPSPTNCRQQALRFDQSHFMLNFKKQVDSLWSKKQQLTIL
jgi:glycosyltransferase involved in cell wall biosynthesis